MSFSPELNAARLLIKAWSLLVNNKGRKVSSRLVSRTLKQAGISPEARGFNDEVLQEKLKEAYKMSTISRAKSDELTYQAEQLLKEIENEN